MVLRFQALKEKETLVVEEVPAETPSRDHHEIVVDVEVAKIASENLTTSEGQDAAKIVAGTTPDDVEQEERPEVRLYLCGLLYNVIYYQSRTFDYSC
jgi:hypothetical protein